MCGAAWRGSEGLAMGSSFEAGRFGSGQAVHRIEDAALLAGQGRFTDDVAAAGETCIAFLRSPYAHARIASVDAAAARAMPGVLAVYTGADLAAAGVKPIPTIDLFKRADGSALASPMRRALADQTVRFVGEAVAAVVAESRDAARDACEAIAVDYEELPASSTLAAAVAPGAPVLCPEAPDNIAAEMRHGERRGDRAGVRARRPCRRARPRQPARRAEPDRAAQRARRIRRRERPPDGAPEQPDADGRDELARRCDSRASSRDRCASSSAMSAAASA